MVLDSGLSSGLFGLQKAQAQIAQSAEKIVNPSAAEMPSFEKSLTENAVENTKGLSTQNVIATVAPQADVAQEAVSMHVAARTYEANLKVIKTWNSMTQVMLDAAHKPTDETV